MLRTANPSSSSTISQSLIDVTSKNKVDKNVSNKINLSNLSALKKSTGAGYLISKGAKKDGNNFKKSGSNTKKSVKTAISFNYLTLDAKKAFNYL